MYMDKDGMRAVSDEDKAVTALLPGTNLARLVMVHWNDEPTSLHPEKGMDCYDPAAESTGFLTQRCLSQFDAIVNWAARKAGMWVIVTARASLAAGDGDEGRTVWSNATLRGQMVAMWRYLAYHYKDVDNIAGFEVMSEPRTDSFDEVHAFHVDACSAIWAEDAKAICFVGPGAFYDRYNLRPEYVVAGGPVVYAVNFFEPNVWVGGGSQSSDGKPLNSTVVYGQSARCCDATKKTSCGGKAHCDETIVLNKAFLDQQLAPAVDFSMQHDVPVWIDQWGVEGRAGGGPEAQSAYLRDVLDLFEQHGLHWSYWLYRRPRGSWSGASCPEGYAMYCEMDDGSGHVKRDIIIDHLSKYIEQSSFEMIL